MAIGAMFHVILGLNFEATLPDSASLMVYGAEPATVLVGLWKAVLVVVRVPFHCTKTKKYSKLVFQ